MSTPVIAAGALYAVGALLDELGVHAVYVGLVVTFAVVGAAVACRKAQPGRFATMYAVTVSVLSGAWLTWVTATTAWSARALTVLFCGLGFFGPLWFLARHTHHRKRLKEEEEEHRRIAAAEARRWPELLAGLGLVGVTQLERVNHSDGCYTLRLQLPADGKVKYGSINNKTEEIEIAAGLRYGAIHVERGKSAAEVLLHVNEVDILAKTVPIPRDHTPLSINNPLPLGLYEDSTVVDVRMQGRASKTVGLRGKGKSNLINVKLAALTRCVDVVVWMIDNKGGRTARPWLLPWLEDRTHRPVIDWVATTDAEVGRMLRAAKAVIDYRANSGEGGDKIVPTARLPEVMIVCEEVALIFGQHDMANLPNARLGLQIVQLGRSEAVDVDLVAQRGTVTMLGSGDLKSQLENTFGLGVADPNDARYIFGNTKVAADLAKLEHPGSMLVQAGRDTRIVPAKAWWVEHSEIGSPGGIAEGNTYVGPDLDAGSAAAANAAGDYYDRWSYERAGHLIPNARPNVAVPTPTARHADMPKSSSTAERLGLAPSKLVQSPFDKPSEDSHSSFMVIEGGKQSGHAAPSGMNDVPSLLATVYNAFVSARADRLHTTRLLEEPDLTGFTAKRLGMLLARYGVEPCEHPFVAGSERGRGYAYTDVAAAVQRYTGGGGESGD
ncbi:MAG: hypothetical protein GEV07_16685 [Streptosporangiales bacterium]|nr:hypothetical protein [Streptosporangiales bacterium]